MLGSFKKKIILLFFLFVLFGAFIFYRFIILNNQDVYGRVKIVSSPASGVFIDNAPAGRTPFENKYKVGEYNIKLIPEGNGKGIASWQGKIKINKNALTYVNRELGSSDNTSAGEILTISKMTKKPENPNFGEIYVESDPSGTIISLDNDEKGIAPFTMERVLKGDHEISAYLPGFLNRTQKISVTAGYRVNVAFKLALDPNQEKPIASPSSTITASPSGTLSPTAKPSGTAKAVVEIQETPLGFLRVRSEPSINASESAQVKPGETYPYLDEQSGWYKIKLQQLEGWVSSEYAVKK
ncbi:MAG: PEGA domain-containing protein [Patescibacteria group bacterium]